MGNVVHIEQCVILVLTSTVQYTRVGDGKILVGSRNGAALIVDWIIMFGSYLGSEFRMSCKKT